MNSINIIRSKVFCLNHREIKRSIKYGMYKQLASCYNIVKKVYIALIQLHKFIKTTNIRTLLLGYVKVKKTLKETS